MIKSYLKWLSPRFQMFTGAYDLRKAAMIVQARDRSRYPWKHRVLRIQGLFAD